MKIYRFYFCRFKGWLQALSACEKGAAFIEFAICLPLIILLFLGGVEVSRYLFIVKKLQNVVNAETNIITSTNPVTKTLYKDDMDSIVTTTFQRMMAPYGNITNSVMANGILIITDIYADPAYQKSPGTPIVKWRYCGGGLFYDVAHNDYTGLHSKFGEVGKPADLSSLIVKSSAGTNQFLLNSGDEIVVAEVFYEFIPMLQNSITSSFIPQKTVYFVSLSVPRFSHLTDLVGTRFQGNCS